MANLLAAVALVTAPTVNVPMSPPAMPAMVDAITDYRATLLTDWLHDLNGPYRTPRRPPTGGVGVAASGRGIGSDVEQWRPLVEAFFGANTDAALRVMACESGGNPNAVNPFSGASGLFQFMGFWWRGVWDPFDPAENVARAAELSQGGTDWSAWTCKP